MRKLHYPKEVLASWKRCMERLSHNAESPVIHINPGDIAKRQIENLELVTAFQNCISLIKDLIPGQVAFLLVDACGILLKKNQYK